MQDPNLEHPIDRTQGHATDPTSTDFYPHSYPLTEPRPVNTGPNTHQQVVSKTTSRLSFSVRAQ
jgi:hypothetical protein